jgi:hypothetical protein
MSDPTAIPVEPDPDDGVAAVTVGLVLWAVAGVACFLWRDTLADRGAEWWAWSSLAGLGIGLGLLGFTRRRARVYREYGQRAQGAASSPAGPA